MNRVFISALCIALTFVGVSFFVPLSTVPVSVVPFKGSLNAITLTSGSHIRERVHLSKGTYSGIAIFSDAFTLNERTIHVTINDSKGNKIAKGSANNTSYLSSENVLQIDIPVSWFSVVRDGFYVVDITFPTGEALPLRGVSPDDVSEHAMLSLLFTKRIPTVFGLQQGIMIGSAFLLTVALVSNIQSQRKKYLAAVVLIVLFAPLATLGYWFSTGDLGIADWDFYFTLHDSYRKAILEHYTLPLWNPYICGGTAGLGDPEFPVFSPTFLLELIFGIPVGIRLAIIFSVIGTATGMLALARSLGRSVEAGLIAALAVAFGTVSLLEITEGHVNVMAAMWVPWILWAWLGVYRGSKKPIICGIFLAAAFLGGGIYLLMYTAFAFAVLFLFVPHRVRAIRSTVQSGIWALGFVSFKLVPVLYWLKQFPDDAYQGSAYTLPWIVDILFGRYLHGSYVILDQASGWHEYGAYIGYGVFALSLIGISYIRKSRIVFALVVSAVIALLVSALGPYLKPVFDPLWFFPRSNISRLILFAVIPIALLAAYGADRIARLFSGGSIVRALLVGIIAIDIISLTYQLSEQAFILPHVVPAISPAPHPIAYTTSRYDQSGEGSRTTRSFDAYMAGYGTFAYCSVLGPTPGVSIISDEGNTSVVSAIDLEATVSLLSWSYNVVRVHVDTPKPTTVVLNANYVDGWMVGEAKATIFSNRVAADVPAGSRDIVFRYKPPGLHLGVTLSALTLMMALYTRKRYS